MSKSNEHSPEDRLKELGLSIPTPPAAVGAYESWQKVGNIITTSFQLPWVDGKLAFIGLLGKDLSTEQGYTAARICAMNGIAQLKAAADGNLRRVRIFRVEGHVGCVETFEPISQVLNGGSELINEAFGVMGRHSRTALGHVVMPLRAPVMLGFWAELIS